MLQNKGYTVNQIRELTDNSEKVANADMRENLSLHILVFQFNGTG
jgi:hypothetical protein